MMGADVTLCCPPTLLPFGLNESGTFFPHVSVESNIEKAIEGADVVMSLGSS
jgi:aspartate carbamoyltransferase catalytic subunit